MSIQISIIEKVVGQTERQAYSIQLASERIPARLIVEEHVRAEVDRVNSAMRLSREKQSRVASFLVGPHSHEVERKLNPMTRRAPKLLDAEAEISTALDAVSAHRIIMLFDDREVNDLDEMLTVTDDSSITFLRLVPLIGG